MWQASALAGTVGLEITVGVLIAYYAGPWLDDRLGTGPWLRWVCLVIGPGVAVSALVRAVRSYNRAGRPPEKR